jgi:predicted ferric reductase
MRTVTQYSIPVLALSFVGGFVFWAYPEGGGVARQTGIILGWTGCGLLLASLFLVLREPRLASLLGGLEHMYRWHHRLGIAAYAVLLAHPLMLAGASLPHAPKEAWALLSPLSEGWPVWTGWLSLLLLMAGLGVTFARRLAYRIRRLVHAAMGLAVPAGLIHIYVLGIEEPVLPILAASLALLVWRFVREDWGMGALPYVVRSVGHAAVNAIEVSLAPAGEPVKVRPGQFALVAFQSGRGFKGCGEFHPFSVSAIDGADAFRVTVKALGDCTRQIQSIVPGVLARVQGGFGNFLEAPAPAPQFWIAGGIGLTPFLSLLRAGSLDRPTTMIYLYRVEADALFLDELREIAGRLPQLTLRLIATGDGMPDPASILDGAGETGTGEFWLCGPPPMIEIFSRYLHRRGIANRRMHFENFGSL